MVTVCQTCGDRGFSVALIYCDECQAYAIHRYCLYKLPETFEEHVAWFCADCEPKVAESTTLQQALPAIDCQSGLKKGSVIRKSKGKNDIKKKNKKSKCDSGSLVISKVERQISPSLPTTFEEHVVGFSADYKRKVAESSTPPEDLPVTDFQSRLKRSSSGRKLKGKTDIKKLKKNKKKSKYDSGSLAISKVQRQSSPSIRPPENLEEDETLGRSLGVGGSSTNKETRLIEAKTPPLKTCTHSGGSDWVNMDEGAESVNNRTSLVAINDHLSIIEHNFFPGWGELDGVYSDEAAECVHTKAIPVATSNPIPRHSYVHAQPIFEPTWRGSIRLYDENLTVGALAHLSCLACLKVCETAKRLPQLLCVELLPRCDVWPKSFEKWGPSGESIALYFFPCNGREREIFDSLIDKMICRDLGMRAIVEDAELLVYTSNKLPQQFWRFQEKLYLWGVFRAKQASHLTNVAGGEEKNLLRALTWDSRSPVSPFSDSGSCLSGYGNSLNCTSVF